MLLFHDLAIYVLSTARAHKSQSTVHLLEDAKVNYKYVLHPDDISTYGTKACHPLVCPDRGIHLVRQWILDNTPYKKLVMLDDDLRLYEREKNVKSCKNYPYGRFRAITQTGTRHLFVTISKMLDTYAHGGVAEKFMCQRRPMNFQTNKRYFHILCYNKKLFPIPHPTYRTRTGEDHDMNLQLLKRGRANFLLTDWAHADSPWTEGGCNTWRTPEINEQATKHLQQLHQDVISIVENPTKDLRNHGNPSFSIKINWKKAAEIGATNHE